MSISKRFVFVYIIGLLFPALSLYAQNDSISKNQNLKEVVVSSNRIDIPFSKDSRTIQWITAEQLQQSGFVTAVAALQQIAGVDIRRRGLAGTQADLYLRGGGFDQTLLLIDGIPMDDAQTGHHSLNFLPPIAMIERIEVIKGPASRVYGQNAFTGAVNIVTKKETPSGGQARLKGGSYGQLFGGVNVHRSDAKSNFVADFSRMKSEGYRYNTDFNNYNAFVKADFRKATTFPIQLLATYGGRKFGANGFYASPEAKDQYEETEASLLAVQSDVRINNWRLRPKLYWRRGQDHYIYLRSQPEIYENWHITHKLGTALHATYVSDYGITGVGVDVSRVSISSNNLGQHHRETFALFLEQRFSFWDLIDLTPGIAVNRYSDFGAFAYPGLDLGVQLNNSWRIYGNMGYTYRIPTYTDLYYRDRTTIGNADLKPEEALAAELGLRYTPLQWNFYIAYFNRRSKNLIDYVKSTAADLWKAENIAALQTQGVETEVQYQFLIGKQSQRLKMGYTYLVDDLKEAEVNFSRYSINSLKHHFTFASEAQLSSQFLLTTALKYGQRPEQEGYTVLDVNLQWQKGHFTIDLSANNILNTLYSETNLVPMPGSNGLLSLKYQF